MATAAPFVSPVLANIAATSVSTSISSAPVTLVATAVASKVSSATPNAVKAVATKAGSSTYVLYRLARNYTRNTRITPIATYLAYKSTGYADNGSIAGMTISDFVAVWTPYNIDPAVKKRTFGKSMGKGVTAGAGTKESTAKIVLESEGREGRPARQSVKFRDRRRHYCRQEGCEQSAV